MAPDDPVHNEPSPDRFSFSGDGDRSQEEDARPEALPPPEGKPDPVTLQHSGALATRHIIGSTTIWHRAAEGEATANALSDDTAVTARVIAAARRFVAHGEAPAARFRWRANASASLLLEEWLATLTAADSAYALVACTLEAARAAIGEAAFDASFGDRAGNAALGRLRIDALLVNSSAEQLMRFAVAATSADPVHAGEWFPFSNAPAYRYKHPGGRHEEMCLCVGEEAGQAIWSGLGVRGDEARMVQAMVERYDAPRDDADRRWLATRFPDGHIPSAYANYAERIEASAVLGLDRSTGVALNHRTLAALRERYH